VSLFTKKFNYFLKSKPLLSFIFLFSLLIILRFINPSYIQSISNFSFDTYQKIFHYELKESPVVIIDVDENSLGQIGQFPWNRKIFADLIDQMVATKPSTIVFDIFFSEEDKQNPTEIVKSYKIDKESSLGKELLKLPNNDNLFLEKIKNNNIALPILGQIEKPLKVVDRKPIVTFITKGTDPKNFIYKFPYNLSSLEKINEQAKGLGSISVVNDTGGIFRKAPLLINIQDQIFPSLAIEALRLHLKQKNILIETSASGVEAIKLRPYSISTNPNAMLWIKFKKPMKDQYVSAVDILNNKFDKKKLEGKILLIGSSAQGLFDFVGVSNGKVIPGVEVHANIIENIINNDYLHRDNYTFLIEMVMMIIGMLLAYFFAGNVKPKFSLFSYVFILIVITIVGFSFYKFKNQLIDISYPIFCVNILFFNRLYFRYVEENKIALVNFQKQLVLKQEREIAGEVQKKLFPEIDENEKHIFARNIPAHDVSGDYYDFTKINDHEFYFTLADVSGKGVKAGILMANAAAVFRSLTRLKMSVSSIAFNMNNQVADSSYQGMFITAVIGKANTQTKEVEFINLGHEPIMIFDNNFKFDYIKSDFPPLGVMTMDDESFFATTKMNLNNKTLLVYTDGVTEGYIAEGVELTVKGIEEIVKNTSTSSPKVAINKICEKLSDKVEKLRDDITCLGIKV
jgi:CHASE2 domain-containing sensor protein